MGGPANRLRLAEQGALAQFDSSSAGGFILRNTCDPRLQQGHPPLTEQHDRFFRRAGRQPDDIGSELQRLHRRQGTPDSAKGEAIATLPIAAEGFGQMGAAGGFAMVQLENDVLGSQTAALEDRLENEAVLAADRTQVPGVHRHEQEASGMAALGEEIEGVQRANQAIERNNRFRCRITGIGVLFADGAAVDEASGQAGLMPDDALVAQVDDRREQRPEAHSVVPGGDPPAFVVERAVAAADSGVEVADQFAKRHVAPYFFR